MDWYLPVVEKWIADLVHERGLPDVVHQQTLHLLARLHEVGEAHRLVIPLPAVENEVLPVEESADQCTLALTWVGPATEFRLMYVPVPQAIRLCLVRHEQQQVLDNPANDDIVHGLLAMGVQQAPAEGPDVKPAP